MHTSTEDSKTQVTAAEKQRLQKGILAIIRRRVSEDIVQLSAELHTTEGLIALVLADLIRERHIRPTPTKEQLRDPNILITINHTRYRLALTQPTQEPERTYQATLHLLDSYAGNQENW
ncbi:MAG TPA: hypothetical protein VJB87_05215 [Candidatus Nanoarchaeia archaeon]|nr:hypothetical protein [Candidatus Nanoarchaeia archaeon]